VCDPAETCTGAATCPANMLAPSTVICRPSAGPCDADDKCPGNSPSCSGDTKVAAGVQCNPGDPVNCKNPTVCDGVVDSCPAPTSHCPALTRCCPDNTCIPQNQFCNI
jgi:hypothetical protein